MRLLHRHSEQLQKIEELTKELETSPAFKKMREEQAAKILAKRKKSAGKIEALEREAMELATGKDDLDAKVRKMEAELLEMRAAMNEKKVRLMQQKASYESLIRREMNFLCDSYDPEIDEAITFFEKKLDFLRSPGRISRIAGGAKKNLFAWKKKVTAESNRAAVVRALNFCREAITTLEKMKLEPVLDSTKIEKLKEEIPSIDEFQQFSGEKPMEAVQVQV